MIRKRNGIKLDITKLEIFAEKNGVAQLERSLREHDAEISIIVPRKRPFVMPGQEENFSREEIIKKIVSELYVDLAFYIETHDDLNAD
jgi:hypothetical protein